MLYFDPNFSMWAIFIKKKKSIVNEFPDSKAARPYSFLLKLES